MSDVRSTAPLPAARNFPLRIKAVMIDLDGTLLDTIPDLATAANAMLEKLGRAPLPVATLTTFVGKGIGHLVERATAGSLTAPADPALCRQALPVFEHCYAEINGRYTTVYPGVMEGLKALRHAGFPLVCVTNKSERFTLPLLAMQGLAHYFEFVVAGDTLARKKPDPLPLTHACERLGIAPGEMLMIGDSVNDAQAARAAGCPIFCVPYGYNEGRAVRELDIDAIVPTLLDAIPLITKV
jgi:phosphoglycolate phosphatase